MTSLLNNNTSTEGWFTSEDLNESWDTELLWWSTLPVVAVTWILVIGFVLELCLRRLSLNNPGIRVKTLIRTFKRRSKKTRTASMINGPQYRYEMKDRAVYTYNQVDEYFPFNRIFLWITFHVVSLGICFHLCHRERLIWCSWIWFFAFLIFIWFAVS